MSAEVWTILSVGVALGGLVIGLGGFMWWMLQSFRNEMDRRFEQVAECIREERRQIARLTDDHNAFARELSELRGEICGHLDERARPAPAD